MAFTATFRWWLWQQKALRDQRKELQDLMVAHMTGAKGISVDPDLTEKTAKVRAQWVILRGVRSTYVRGSVGQRAQEEKEWPASPAVRLHRVIYGGVYACRCDPVESASDPCTHGLFAQWSNSILLRG